MKRISLNKKNFYIIFVTIIVAISLPLLLIWIFYIPHSPEDALQQFYTYESMEDELKDPLIIAGPKVVPLLIKEIQNKDMPHRLYAIRALGDLGDSSALNVLKSILNDTSEIDYFRCGALEAIALIDIDVARELAKQYKETDITSLSEISRYLLSHNKPPHWVVRRTYIEALFDYITNPLPQRTQSKGVRQKRKIGSGQKRKIGSAPITNGQMGSNRVPRVKLNPNEEGYP
ncbi:MAG: HEAT repeat domain-containing protein [Nitrospirae bacterium]|nr:HEAT repeat domain-containing protein [Nitrospirota bacterium]